MGIQRTVLRKQALVQSTSHIDTSLSLSLHLRTLGIEYEAGLYVVFKTLFLDELFEIDLEYIWNQPIIVIQRAHQGKNTLLYAATYSLK